MKIAVISDDTENVSRHFDRAPYYVVFTVEEGQIVGKEVRKKPFYQHQDCIYQDSSAPGTGAAGDGSTQRYVLTSAGREVIVTHLTRIDEVISRHLAGKLSHHPERLP